MSATEPSPPVVVERRGNPLAVAALVLGVVGAAMGVVMILAVPALLLGAVAVAIGLFALEAAKNPARGGRRTALAGCVLGVLAVALGIVGIVFVGAIKGL